MSFLGTTVATIAAVVVTCGYLYWRKLYTLTPDAAGVFLLALVVAGAVVLAYGKRKAKKKAKSKPPELEV